MSKIDYNEMTNAELKAIIDDFEIDVEAKIPGKPNKAELVAALEKYKAEQDALNGVNDSDDKNDDLSPGSETVVREAVPQRLLPKNERKKLQLADKMRKERVIVIDKQHTQTRVPAITVSWGNGLIGIYSDVINLPEKE